MILMSAPYAHKIAFWEFNGYPKVCDLISCINISIHLALTHVDNKLLAFASKTFGIDKGRPWLIETNLEKTQLIYEHGTLHFLDIVLGEQAVLYTWVTSA